MLKSLSSTLGKWRSGKYSFRDISHGIKILKVKVSLPGNLHMLASFFSGLAETHVDGPSVSVVFGFWIWIEQVPNILLLFVFMCYFYFSVRSSSVSDGFPSHKNLLLFSSLEYFHDDR